MSDAPDRQDGPTAQLGRDLLDRWLPGAMFPSELLWLAGELVRSQADVVIECGRQDGISTWALGTALRGTGARVLSVDFDLDAARRRTVEALVADLPVTCISGDVHREVPRLLGQLSGRVAVVQDGPKGWEGLATTLAAGLDPKVVVVAQHNLHVGHRSRTAFQMVASDACFLETASTDEAVLELRAQEQAVLVQRAPNRPVDHSSLGLIHLDDGSREHLRASLGMLRLHTWPWDPLVVRRHWDEGDLDHVPRLRDRARLSPARWKKR